MLATPYLESSTDAHFDALDLRDWPSDLTVHDGRLYVAAGRHGLYRFDSPAVPTSGESAGALGH